jgi:hypothetical protein
LTLSVDAPEGTLLELSGPPAVDSAYQIFADGRLLGGIGDFSGKTPTAYSIQPRMYALPATVSKAHPLTIAVRVFMGPWDNGPDDAGGMHIAPAIGELSSIERLYQAQWLETIKGYVLEVIEAFLFVMLAVMSLALLPFDRTNTSYRWLAFALLLVAAYRANQAVFFWGQFESVHTFELVSYVMLVPCCLGAWVMAWRAWFAIKQPSWLCTCIVAVTLSYAIAQCMNCSFFFGVWPAWMTASVSWLSTISRLLLLLTLIYIVIRGVRETGREGWYALPSIVFISIGLFAQELSALHVPGIWFPFGTGVSRTQFAYIAFDIAFAILLLQRLWCYARETRGLESSHVH